MRFKPALFTTDSAPKYIRCYDDNGESIDRYTVVFTGHYRSKTGGEFWHATMNDAPFHPQGFGQHGSGETQIDRPRSSHLGRRITFTALPEECRRLILNEYIYLWDTLSPKGEQPRED